MTFRLNNTFTPDLYNANKLQSSLIPTTTPVDEDLLLFGSTQWDFFTSPTISTYSNPYTASMYSTDINSISTGTVTQLLFTTQDWDTSGNMVELSDNQIKIVHTGKYWIRASTTVVGNIGGTFRRLQLRKNGVVVMTELLNVLGTDIVPLLMVTTIECEADDIITVFGEQDSGSTLAMSTGTSQGMTRLTVNYQGD
jgi:hypothetical protein